MNSELILNLIPLVNLARSTVHTGACNVSQSVDLRTLTVISCSSMSQSVATSNKTASCSPNRNPEVIEHFFPGFPQC